MKRIKKMLSDCTTPSSTGAAMSIPNTSVSFEIIIDRVFHNFQLTTNRLSNAVLTPGVLSLRADKQLQNKQFDIPLVKASTRIVAPDNVTFAGRTVLCVGGQKNLYPAYRQIVEDADGQFSSFHGSYNASMAKLSTLLEKSDLVICPIDCVRHEAFWLTKHYCKRFCKPCVMLDKSRVTTFYNGVRMLKNIQ